MHLNCRTQRASHDTVGVQSHARRPSAHLTTTLFGQRLTALRKLPRQRQKLVLDLIDTVLRDSMAKAH